MIGAIFIPLLLRSVRLPECIEFYKRIRVVHTEDVDGCGHYRISKGYGSLKVFVAGVGLEGE